MHPDSQIKRYNFSLNNPIETFKEIMPFISITALQDEMLG